MEINEFLLKTKKYSDISFWDENLVEACRQLSATYPGIKFTLYFNAEKINGKTLIVSTEFSRKPAVDTIQVLFESVYPHLLVVAVSDRYNFARIQSFFLSKDWILSGDETTHRGLNCLTKIER